MIAGKIILPFATTNFCSSDEYFGREVHSFVTFETGFDVGMLPSYIKELLVRDNLSDLQETVSPT